VQGLIASGSNPGRVRAGGRSPLDYLASVQAGDGHYRYSRSSDQTPVWVTAQALAAVSGEAFPLGVVPRAPGAESDAAPSAGEAGSGGSGADGAPAGSGNGRVGDSGGTAHPAATSGELAPAAEVADGDGSAWVLQAVGGILLLALALWGGWLIYRRRLP